MENALSRRNFIGGALIAGAGMVGAALCPGAPERPTRSRTPPALSGTRRPTSSSWAAVRRGFGAAVQAYDNNLSAIVLEKQPEESAGGDVRCCGGYLFPISTDPNVLMSTGLVR